MNNKEALEIVEQMIQKRQALSAETLTPKQWSQTQQIINALQLASQALQNRIKTEARQSSLPNNAGKSWTDEENQQIIEAFNNGESIATIAERHQRTKGAITSRLSRLGIQLV